MPCTKGIGTLTYASGISVWRSQLWRLEIVDVVHTFGLEQVASTMLCEGVIGARKCALPHNC